MPALSDKLKALGVKVGTKDLPKPHSQRSYTIERVRPGRVLETHAGETYLVEELYGPEFRYGLRELAITAPLDRVAEWAGERTILGCTPEQFAYLDLETTGLMGGTGTYAFLVGVGRYEGDRFRLAQFFMRDPGEEAAHLLALEDFLAGCKVLVTFNGKAFDAPLLNTRYLLQGWKSPLLDVYHVDLLHLARRLWRSRLPSRTLGNLEVFILDARRSQEDIPGWMIPQIYFEYLSTSDARPLTNVFYHNAMDVLAMAALLNHVAHLLADPLHAEQVHDLDLVAIARLSEDLGREQEAVSLYRLCLERSLDKDAYQDVLQRLSFLHKRRGEQEDALALWRQAVLSKQVYACVELAKVDEHERRDYEQAAAWTRMALEWIADAACPPEERETWQPELQHRLERLERKTK